MASTSASHEGTSELQRVCAKIAELEAQAKTMEDRANKAGKGEGKARLETRLVQLEARLVELEKQKTVLLQQSVGGAGTSTAVSGVTDISFSSIGSEQWLRITQASGLELTMAVPLQPRERHVQVFEWGPGSECSQKQQYLEHLRTILQLPAAYDVHDADSFPNLLTWSVARGDPPVRLKGTTDAFVCRKAVRLPQAELLVLFEVKKQVESRHLFQAMAVELSAELLRSRTSPICVLTDLRDSWEIFWVDGNAMCSFTGTAASAMGFIDSVVAQAEQELSNMVVPGVVPAEPVPEDASLAQVHKRARLKLPGVAAELDVAPLHDLMQFDVLPEEERRATLLHALRTALWRQCAPAFSGPEESEPSMYC